MNIFRSIREVTSRTEPFHSQFLADALDHSLNSPDGDRSLFCEVWKLAAPDGWDVPNEATIKSEDVVPDVGRRIDISIRSDKPHIRVLGIEVKTIDASAKDGQLDKYLNDLERKYPNYDIQLAYLTPFNRVRAGDRADTLATVRVFDEFCRRFPSARHLSWLDIAEIPWDGNEIWKQHQDYVCKQVSPLAKLERPEFDRELSEFFGEGAVWCFSDKLAQSGVDLDANPTHIRLSEINQSIPSFANLFIESLEILLGGHDVLSGAKRGTRFPDHLRRRFLDSPYSEIHKALFCLEERFSFVWIQGKRDYGIRVALEGYPGGVSVVTSHGTDCLKIGQRR